MLFEAAELILGEAARVDEELKVAEEARGDHGGGELRRLRLLRSLLDDLLQTLPWPMSSSSAQRVSWTCSQNSATDQYELRNAHLP